MDFFDFFFNLCRERYSAALLDLRMYNMELRGSKSSQRSDMELCIVIAFGGYENAGTGCGGPL